MKDRVLQLYWDSLPVGRENAVEYSDLCAAWVCSERRARAILHELSRFDSGDDFILIRSSSTHGFYRTDSKPEIEAYKRECLAKGRSIFAPLKKINRVLDANDTQYSLTNNLRVRRESVGLTQDEVCQALRIPGLDKFLLSKMENGICLPTQYQLMRLAAFYGCKERELLAADLL